MKRIAVLLLLLLATLPARGQESYGAATINQLLHLPVPEQMEFCGEPVPLDRIDVAERLDLELVVTLGSPVRTTLWFKRMPRYLPLV